MRYYHIHIFVIQQKCWIEVPRATKKTSNDCWLFLLFFETRKSLLLCITTEIQQNIQNKNCIQTHLARTLNDVRRIKTLVVGSDCCS